MMNLEELNDERRRTAASTIRVVSFDELAALSEKLFPDADHPWLEIYADAVNGPYYTGQVEGHMHFLYCPSKRSGLWYYFYEETKGMGPLPDYAVQVLDEIIRGIR